MNTHKMTNMTDNVAMNESTMMNKMKSGAWRVARGVMIVAMVTLVGLTGFVKKVEAAPIDNTQFEYGMVNASSTWQTVNFFNTYTTPVVVATPNLNDAGDNPVVVRMRNIGASSFEVRLQNPSDSAVTLADVYYLVVEQGVYDNLEAHTLTSTTTAENGAWGNMQTGTMTNTYTKPVVLGQVMTFNDTNWSTFVSYGSTRNDYPTNGNLVVGKHVGEDTNVTRNDETLGYVIIEAGSRNIGGENIHANIANATSGGVLVSGVDDAPPYNYPVSGVFSADTALATHGTVNGGDGGWAVLYGATPFDASTISLAIDEDQINDTERSHGGSEEVGYLVFETPFSGGDPAHCTSGVLDGDETGIDCGGSCSTACAAACDYEIDPTGTIIEAEDFVPPIGAANPWEWEVRTNTVTDGNGNSNNGAYLYTTNGGTGADPQGSRVDYPITITTAGTYEVWIRALDQPGGGGGDSVFWGVNGNYVGAITQSADNEWAWSDGVQNGTNQYYFAAGDYVISMWPREAGQHFDAFVLYETSNTTPFSTNNDTTTPGGLKSIDPSCTDSGGGGGGGGSGTITIPVGQGVNGVSLPLTAVNLVTYDPSTIGADELIYDPTDQTSLTYRALGGESDGFHGFVYDSNKWSKTDVGGDTTPDATVSGGELHLIGSGSDIWNTNDSFTYLYQPNKSGDFTIDVEVKSIQNTNQWAKAGIMVRPSLSSLSQHVMIVVTPSNGVRLQYRPTDGAQSENPTPGNNNTAPKWLRLVRSGDVFEGFWSDDAVTWTSAGTATVTMTGLINIGLAVTSHDTNQDCEAVFDNFMFMPAGTSGMSATWTDVATPINTDDGVNTAWVDGVYAFAVKSDTPVFDTNTFGFSSCVDSTPSSISIPSGQTVSGSAVSLSSLFTVDSGNVGSFTYQIDGVDVTSPWNSYSVEPDGSFGTHSLRVSGVDPDCGSVIVATGSFEVDNTCSDPTPSSLTILTGQAVGGTSVDLTALVAATGNVGGVVDGSYDLNSLTYKINGTTIASPTSWDSTAFGDPIAEDVTLEVSGIDPDCNNTVTAINIVTVDNVCTVNEPSISFDKDVGYVGPGRAIPYTVTIRNEDSFNCPPTTFDVAITNDGDITTNFTSSYFNPAGSNNNITLQGRESYSFELAVEARDGATEWAEKDVELTITSVEDPNGTHNDGPTPGKTRGSVKTKVFLVSPITHNSVTTGSSKWGGNWGTSELGSKYGNFTCLTCHDKGGPNIKWMRNDITTPDGSNWEGAGKQTVGITFSDARSSTEIEADADTDNTVYWGDDDPDGADDLWFDYDGPEGPDSAIQETNGVGRLSSDRVCEVCHSITWYHRYDTQSIPNLDGVDYNQQGRIDPIYNTAVGVDGGLRHFPDRDCTDCHRHSLGFTASCTGCHGDPPLTSDLGGPNGLADIPAPTGSVTPGTHYKHTVVLGYPCEYCHAGWRDVGEMPKEVEHDDPNDDPDLGFQPYQDINHLFNVFYDLGITDDRRNGSDGTDPQYPVSHYTGQGGVSYEGVLVSPGDGTMTCENVYCHGGADDPNMPGSNMGGNNPQWNGNITCNACHGTSAADTPPGYSHTTHVGQMGLACTVCHFTDGEQPGYNGHVNGRVNIKMDFSSTGIPTANGVPEYDPDTSAGPIAATDRWDSNPDGDDLPPSNSYGSCMNVACHYYNETPRWNNGGQPATCTTCHNNSTADGTPDGSHGDGSVDNAAPNSGPNGGSHALHMDQTSGLVQTYINKCESCHGPGANTATHSGHIDYAVDFIGNMSYTEPNCTIICHVTAPDAPEITWGADPSAQEMNCTYCHIDPYTGPNVVDITGTGQGINSTNNIGSHVDATGGDTISGLSHAQWTTQCKQCHPGHDDVTGAEVFLIPEPVAAYGGNIGFNYPGAGGVHLGGTATNVAGWYVDSANPTEAEMCWGCHAANTTVNEMTSQGVITAAPYGPYNGYGISISSTKNNADWTTATFDAPGTVIPTRPVASIHSVNSAAPDSSVQNNVDVNGRINITSLETQGDIRCSYCHDVHDLNYAIDLLTGNNETETGAPYLRGSWLSNPYPLERPPEWHSTNTAYQDSYGSTNQWNPSTPGSRSHNFSGTSRGLPRLLASSDASKIEGGFFIDLNSGEPTKAYLSADKSSEVNSTAGLCTLCHGSDVDNMDYYGASLWRSDITYPDHATNGTSVNGHSNSTLGGTGANKSDIFSASRDVSEHNTFMAAQDGLNNLNYGDTGSRMANNGPFDTDMRDGGDYQDSTNPPPRNIGWYGGTELTTGRSGDWVNWFGTNTIGSGTSTSNRAHDFSCSKCHTPHASGLPALLITNCLDRGLSTWLNTEGNPDVGVGSSSTSGIVDRIQMNCHRKDGTTTGWNRLDALQ